MGGGGTDRRMDGQTGFVRPMGRQSGRQTNRRGVGGGQTDRHGDMQVNQGRMKMGGWLRGLIVSQPLRYRQWKDSQMGDGQIIRWMGGQTEIKSDWLLD